MSDFSAERPLTAAQAAYENGRRTGLATGALALSVVAFINLLGLEKSLLAGAFAIFALQGASANLIRQKRARIALIIAAAHAVTVVVVLAVYHDRLIDLLRQLQKLG